MLRAAGEVQVRSIEVPETMLSSYWPAIINDTTCGFACLDGAGVLYVEFVEARNSVWWAIYI